MKYPSLSFASLLTTALLAVISAARAEIIGIEPFTYSDGFIAGETGGTFWDWQNIAPTNHTGIRSDWNDISAAPVVASGRLVTDNNSALREYNGADEANGAVNGANVFKQVYYRVTLTTGPTLPDFVGMSSYDFGSEKIFFGKPFGQPNFGIAGDVNTNSAIAMEANTTYTLVARLDYDDDLVRLYVNPDLSQPEPASATVSAIYTDTVWSTGIRLASGSGGAVTWDDLAVATTWADLSNVITGTLVTTADDEDNGSLGGGAGISLREAVKYSPSGSLITFDPALSGATILLTNEIVLNRVTIDADSQPGGITVSGGNATRLFTVNSNQTVSLTGLTLTGGNGVGAVSSGNCGAILTLGASTLNLTRCILSGNAGVLAGAFGNRGTATLSQCTLSNNSAIAQSGAIQNQGTLTLEQCTLANNNSGSSGGAILNLFSTNTLTLTNCTLSGNSALNGGGAIANNEGTAVLTDCTLSDNDAAWGGGILNGVGTLALTHCTLALNRSTGTLPGFDGGGGIDSFNGTVSLTACILAGNTAATGTGPDLWDEDGPAVIADNCLIGDGADNFLVHGLSGNQVGTSSSPIDALLFPLGNYGGATQTMPPLGGSPAIDAAGAIALTTDQRGLPRSSGPAPDIGAVELQQIVVDTSNDENDGIGVPPISLRDALTDPNADGFELVRFDPSLNGDTITLGSEIVITKHVSVDAATLGDRLTVKGNNSGRLFRISGRTVTFDNLNLQGGTGGGAVSSGYGGAVLNNFGTLTMRRCSFSGNAAARGGAVASITSLFGSGQLNLIYCTISSNFATEWGGGIYNEAGRARLTHCTVSGNSSPVGAGAASEGQGSFVETIVENSIIAGNGTTDVSIVQSAFNNTFTSLGHNLIGGGDAIGDFNQPGDVTNINPLLFPLGNYGGATPTMPPMPGSPAIDAVPFVPGVTADQRGFLVSSDPFFPPDIGAVELQQILVSTTEDQTNGILSGGISLRDAITDTNHGFYELVRFYTNFSGQTLTLSNHIIVNRNVSVDASTLPAGVTIAGGPGSDRLFTVNGGNTVAFHSLTLTGGEGGGAGGGESGLGGAIYNNGKLTLTRCTLTGNSAPDGGGAIYNNPDGQDFLHLIQCTVAGNSGTNAGGGLWNAGGLMTLTHCTIASNTAPAGMGGGVASFGNANTESVVENTVIAGNTGSDAAITFGGFNSFTSGGHNLIGTGNAIGDFTQTGDITNNTAPMLAPLGNYGGTTKTMPPLPGSPVIDAATNIAGLNTDQRGYPLPVGLRADIGAVEGIYNAAGPGILTNVTRLGNGSIRFSFTNYSDISFSALASTDVALPLNQWQSLGRVAEVPPGSGQFQFTDTQATNHTKRFYRVKTP